MNPTAKPHRRKWLTSGGRLASAFSGALVYLAVWGKGLPYSPIIIGFDRHELDHLVIYMEKGGPAAAYDWADRLVRDVEDFHELHFRSKPALFFYRKAATYARRSPSKARLCACYNGAIVVSPWVQQEDAEGILSLRIYLAHELSHALLFQNMGLRAKLRFPRWLLEGLATCSAGQMGSFIYPSRPATLALIRAGNWMPPETFGTTDEDQVPLDVPERMPFIYSEFACIVDDLIATHGRDRFLRYVKRLMVESDHDAVFRSAFQIDFDVCLDRFRSK